MKFVKLISSLVFLLFSISTYSQELSPIDSLINLVKIQKEDTSKVDNLNTICKKFSRSDADTAEYFGNLALSVAKKIKYPSGEALAYKNLGNIVYFQSNYTNAYQLYNKSLVIYEKIEDKKGIAILVRNLGSIYHQQGNFDKALQFFIRSLNARIEIDDKKGIASLYNAMGLVYLQQVSELNSKKAIAQDNKLIDKALEYFNNALDMHKELSNTVGIAQTYYRISSIYKRKHKNDLIEDSLATKNLEKALDFALKFNELSIEIGDDRLLAESNAVLADLYLQEQKYKKSLGYLNKSIELFSNVNSQFGLANSYFSLGKFYAETQNYKKSISYYKKALEISKNKDIHAQAIGKNATLGLSDVFYIIQDTRNSLFYYKKHILLKDSLINEDKKNEIAKLEMNMDFQQQLRKQELETIEKEAEIKRQKTLTYFFIVAFLLMIGLAVVIFRNFKDKQKANLALEEKNEEISKQRQHIMDSIVYAKRIQDAVLPPNEFISQYFQEHFVLFKPRDIVSGDFYWAAKKNNLSIIAAADSTGHGVPGAFMSMLGISFLNHIVNREREGVLQANDVLNELRGFVKKSLRQTGKMNEAQDGMDIALCIFDYENYSLQYAGAYNPLLIIRDGEIIQYKADRMPVGIYFKEKGSFTNHTVEIKKGDHIYIFSDGFIDQFGGEQGEKFLTKRFKKLLLDNIDKTMPEQKELLQKTYENWTKQNTENEYEQLDDILVIGLKIE